MPLDPMRNRLDSLFADLQEGQETSLPPEAARVSGWTFACDSVGRYIKISQGYTQVLGFSEEEILGENIVGSTIEKQVRDRLWEWISQGREDTELEIGFLTKAGTRIPAILHLMREIDPTGAATAFHGFAQVVIPDKPAIAYGEVLPEDQETESTPPTVDHIFEVEPTQEIPQHSPDLHKNNQSSTQDHGKVRKPPKPIEPAQVVQGDGSFPDISGNLQAKFWLDEETPAILEMADQDRMWSSNEASLVTEVANQLSLALENAHLFQSEQQRAQELAILHDVSLELAQEQRDLNTVLALIVDRALDLLSAQLGGIWLQNPSDTRLTLAHASSPIMLREAHYIEPGKGLAGGAYQSGKLMVSQNGTNQQPDEVSSQTDHVYSGLAVPLTWQSDPVGVLAVYRDQPSEPFKANERHLAEMLAGQAAAVIQNVRLFAQTQHALNATELQARRLAQLNVLSELLSQATQVEEVYQTVGEHTLQLLQAEAVNLTIKSDSSTAFERVAVLSSGENSTPDKFKKPFQKAHSKVVKEARIVKSSFHLEGETAKKYSLLAIPVISSGILLGSLTIAKGRGEVFDQQDQNLAVQTASLVASTIANLRLYERTETALSETESLYQASADLNSAQDYETILQILRQFSTLGAEAKMLTLYLFESPGAEDKVTGWQRPIAQYIQGAEQAQQNTSKPFPLWPSITSLLSPEKPSWINQESDPSHWNQIRESKDPHLIVAKAILFLPLSVGRKWIGYLAATYAEPRSAPEMEIRQLTSLASQAAVAIENIQLLEETKRRANQLQTAAEIARDASETLALSELLNRSVHLIKDRFGLYHASIFLLDAEGEYAIVQASTGLAGAEMVQSGHRHLVGSQSVVGHATHSGPLVLNDVSQSQIHWENPLLPETRAELGIPMKIGDRVIGALDVQSREVDAFSPDDVVVLQTLADQIAVAVDNARAYEVAQDAFQETQQHVNELTMLYNVSQSLSGTPLKVKEIATIVANQFRQILGIEDCTVSILEKDQTLHTLVPNGKENGGRNHSPAPDTQRISLDDYPVADRVLRTLQPLIMQSDTPEIDHRGSSPTLKENRLIQLLIPLAAKGLPIGLVEIQTQGEAAKYPVEKLDLAMTLANQAAVVLENARLYEEQRETAEQLRELDKLKSQFLANMSHELRTPLNSIIGFSRVILKEIDGPITDLQQEDLTAIYNAGQHLLGLINDILDLSKIEAGKMELGSEQVDLRELITSVHSTAIGLVKHKPIELKLEIENQLPQVQGDPIRIRQILLNLLSNAAKFTDEGSIIIKAGLSQIPMDINHPEVIVRVTDTGQGISPNDLEKLFQPFSQVDSSPTRKTGGTGLGLSISRHLVEMHEGQIGVESKLGRGSSFFFTIPVAEHKSVGETSQTIRREKGKFVVLSIDDDSKVIGLYERYLKSIGCQVIPLTDPTQCVDIATKIQPDLITLDVIMPKLDGWRVFEELRNTPATQKIPIIICSIVDDRHRGLNLGASDYLVKPILEEDLVNAVQKHRIVTGSLVVGRAKP